MVDRYINLTYATVCKNENNRCVSLHMRAAILYFVKMQVRIGNKSVEPIVE